MNEMSIVGACEAPVAIMRAWKSSESSSAGERFARFPAACPMLRASFAMSADVMSFPRSGRGGTAAPLDATNSTVGSACGVLNASCTTAIGLTALHPGSEYVVSCVTVSSPGSPPST